MIHLHMSFIFSNFAAILKLLHYAELGNDLVRSTSGTIKYGL